MRMKFYWVSADDRYASFEAPAEKDRISLDSAQPPSDSQSWSAPYLAECRWEGDGGPRRRGDFYEANSSMFFSNRVVEEIGATLREFGVLFPVNIAGESALFFRFWVTHVCDCLDVGRSVISKPSNRISSWWNKKSGVIVDARFDESRWDGSDLFRVPQDPNHQCFVSQGFVDLCMAKRVAGMAFSKGLFDDDAIRVAD